MYIRVAPTGKYAQNSKLGLPTEDVSSEECYNACYTTRGCAALTFTNSGMDSDSGTCQLYSHGVGNGKMRLVASPGTMFFNRVSANREAICFDF